MSWPWPLPWSRPSSRRSRTSSTRSSARSASASARRSPTSAGCPPRRSASAVRGNVSRALDALRELREPTRRGARARRRGRPRARRAGPDRRRRPARLPDLDHRGVVALRRARARPGRRRRHRAGVQRDAVAVGRRGDGRRRPPRTARSSSSTPARSSSAATRSCSRCSPGRSDRTSCAASARPSASTPSAPTSPFRARGATHRAAHALAGPGGLFIALDHDVAGLAAAAADRAAGRDRRLRTRRPARRAAGRLRPRLAARCRPRSRSARRARSRSPTSRSARRSSPTRRSATPSRERHLAPLAGPGHGARGHAAHLSRPGHADRGHGHARCTCTPTRSATGCAASRRPPAPPCATRASLVELWWALERRHLQALNGFTRRIGCDVDAVDIRWPSRRASLLACRDRRRGAHLDAPPTGSPRGSSACCWRSRWSPTCSPSSTAASASAARSWRSCWRWRCSARRRPRRSASRRCSSTTCARATRLPRLIANLATFATFPLRRRPADPVRPTRRRPMRGAAFPLLVLGVFMVTNLLNFLMIGGHHALATRASLAGRVPQDLRAGAAVRRCSARCCARWSPRSTCAPASPRSR